MFSTVVNPKCELSSSTMASFVTGRGPRVVVSTAAFNARVRGSVPGLGGLKETKMFLPHPRVKVSIVGSLRDREVACSASDRQGSNFESCVWRTVSSQSSHHPQEVLLAQFSLYVHKGGLKPDSFHFLCDNIQDGCNFLSGKAIARAVRAHLIVDASLNALILTNVLDTPLPREPDTQEQHQTDEQDTAEAATTETDDPPDAEENPALHEAAVLYDKLMDGTMSTDEVCMS